MNLLDIDDSEHVVHNALQWAMMLWACNYRASGGLGLNLSGFGSGQAILHRALGKNFGRCSS